VADLVTGKASRGLFSRRERLIRFMFSTMGIVDALSVVPFWIELMARGLQGMAIDGHVSGFLRALQFARLVRVLKLSKVTQFDLGEDRNMVLQLFTEVLQRARYALQLVILLIVLAMLVFGSLIWFAERGTRFEQGDEACPQMVLCAKTTVHLRRFNTGDYENSPSPFESIPVSFWWVLVTITSVGYGDHFPVTWLGYIVGGATILFGSVVFALPIGIIATAFSQAYTQIVQNQDQRRKNDAVEAGKAVEVQMLSLSREHYDQPPALFVDLWREFHRTALVAGIPMKIASTWKSELFKVARFENFSQEHPCDSLQRWGEPIFATLSQYVLHSACSATRALLRLRVAWYSLLALVSALQCELLQAGNRRKAFDDALRADTFNVERKSPFVSVSSGQVQTSTNTSISLQGSPVSEEGHLIRPHSAGNLYAQGEIGSVGSVALINRKGTFTRQISDGAFTRQISDGDLRIR